MRRLIVSNIMSLDGYYVKGPDWPLEIMDKAFDAYNADRLRASDSLLLGRTTYDEFRNFWPAVANDPSPKWKPVHREISRLDNAIEKVVVSNSLTSEHTEPWRNNTRIIRRENVYEQIAALKQRTGKEILVFGSRTLWIDLLVNDLVDELHLMIGKVILRSGTRVFADQPPVSFRLIDTRSWDGSDNVLVRYAVRPGRNQK